VEESSDVPRVLVVDDIDEVRVLIQRTLSTSGYEVDVAATLAQARAMDPGGYDAVLVDAGLGADRGVDLIEALRAENPAAARRCLVMTGGAVNGIPAGVACLTKPFHAAELLNAVQALHQHTTSAAVPEARISAEARTSPGSPNFSASAGRQPVAMAPAARQAEGVGQAAAARQAEGVGQAAAARQAEGVGQAAAARQPSRADPVDPMDVHIERPRAPSLCTSMGPAAGDGARAAGDGARAAADGARAARDGPAGAAGAQAWQLLGIVRRLRERERHELVDFLHDGPIQGLTVVALGLQMARSQAAVPAPRLAATLQQLDVAAGSLRWLVDGHWASLMARATLADAIRQRTEWLLAAPATVHANARAAVPTAAEIPVIVDVAELMLFAVLPASPPMRADVAVQTEADEIRIELALTAASRDERPASDPAAAQAALGELAFALGAAAQVDIHDQPWRARLVLPRQSGTKAA
jgi:CheY-like chemotaxis protein